MKKFLLLSALMFIGAYFFVGCSNEENEGISVEAQLENIKQKYLYYAGIYGVENLQFDDKLLIKHLNKSDKQIEDNVIHIAVQMGVLEADASSLRKKFRTRSAGNDEEGYAHHTYLYAQGDISDSEIIDTLLFNYTFNLYVQSDGVKTATSRSATVTKRYKCSDSNCHILHEGISDKVNMGPIFPTLNVDWTGDKVRRCDDNGCLLQSNG